MKLFNPLPGFRRAPAGKERQVLRRLPRSFLYGTLLLAAPSLLVRLIASTDSPLIMSTDIYVTAMIVLHWTVLLTVGLAAFIVMVMKGPAYVADPYPLPDQETLDWSPSRTRHGQ